MAAHMARRGCGPARLQTAHSAPARAPAALGRPAHRTRRVLGLQPPTASAAASDGASASSGVGASGGADASAPSSSSRSLAAPGASGSGSSADDLANALAQAQAALASAERELGAMKFEDDGAPGLPDPRVVAFLGALRSAVGLAALAAAMVASHAFGLGVQWAAAAAGAAAIAGWGLSRGALSRSGAAAATLVGLGTLGCSLRFGATLVAFFLSSSKLTAYKEELKEGLEEGARKGGQRDWKQARAAPPRAAACQPPHANRRMRTACRRHRRPPLSSCNL
jgi:hypothetical protein